MPWSGGVFSNIWSWTVDSLTYPNMLPSRFDTFENDQASGITDCINKNGQNAAAANLPMGGFIHTGVGNGAARTNYAAVGQVQDSAFNTAGDTGAADAYVMALSPAITAYANNMVVWLRPANTNTGASTININSVGVKNIKIGSTALSAGQLVAGQTYVLQYDGTQFQVGCITPSSSIANITSGTINGAVIGGVSPAAGTFTTLTCSTFVDLSDERFKRDIKPLEVGIAGLKPVSYTMKDSPGLKFGFIAQEVQKIYPSLVHEIDSRMHLDYMGIIAPLVHEVQMLRSEINKIKETI